MECDAELCTRLRCLAITVVSVYAQTWTGIKSQLACPQQLTAQPYTTFSYNVPRGLRFSALRGSTNLQYTW